MPTALERLKTLKVSLVEKPANEKPRFPIVKSKEGTDMEISEVLKAVIDTAVDGEDKFDDICKEMDEEGKKALKSVMRILNSYKEKIPEEAMKKVAALAGFAQKEKKEDKKEEKKEVKKEESPKEENKGGDEVGVQEEIKKQLEVIEKAHKEQLEEIQKQLDVEKDKSRKQEWIAKCKDELEFYPNKTPVELADGLMELEKLGEPGADIAKAQFEDMKNISATIEKSDMFKESGVSGRGDQVTGAYEKIKKQAEKLIEKDPELTQAQAEAKVLKADPKLYQAYKAEK